MRKPLLAFDPRGEAPIFGVFDECFNPPLAHKRQLWRRWRMLSRRDRIKELILWKMIRIWQWIWWILLLKFILSSKFPSKIKLPMIRSKFSALITEDIVSVQPMNEKQNILWKVDYIREETK